MEPIALSPFTAWESFYVIVGSSAAALTGLQFVVIVLSAEVHMGGADAVRAFGTPNIVHFCAALLVSVILSAPWHGIPGAGLALGACGVAGLIYTLSVVRHARRQRDYTPVLEDWIWHFVLPLLAYGTLLTAAVVLRRDPTPALFVIGATTVLLLFTGIHNAWDSVTYIALERQQRRDGSPQGDDAA